MIGTEASPTDRGTMGRLEWLFGSGWNPRLRRGLFLILFPALVFAGTFRFDFVFDDNVVILGDPLVVRQFDVKGIFGSEVRVADVALGYYRPLITLLYRMDRAIWGLNPAGYHLSNLIWHLLAVLLVYRIALRTTGRIEGAWAGAMLFAVLPAHTEAIGWIQGRVDLVSTAFVLLALLALLRAREANGGSGWLWACLAGVTFLAALLAKESAVVLPLAWATWEVTAGGSSPWSQRLKGLALRFVPLGLAGIVYWLLRRWAVGGSLSFFEMSATPVALRGLAVLAVLAEYGRVLLCPDLGLNFFRTLRVAPTPMTLAIGLAVTLVLGGGLVAAWRWIRPLFPWVAWIPIMLLPPLLFILEARAPTQGFFTAERFLYLASVGWCVLLGSVVIGAAEGAKRAGPPRWESLILVGLILGYAGITLVRLLPWADPVDLYAAIQAQTNVPSRVRILVHNNLGEVYLGGGKFQEARQEFFAALRLDPSYIFPYNNLGVLAIREGRPAEARPWLETAIRLNPRYGEAYGNLGAAYEALGDLSAARWAYEQGLRVAPGSAWLTKGLDRVIAGGALRRAAPTVRRTSQ